MNVVVVIPIYKKNLTLAEVSSLDQALRIFQARDVRFVTYRDLDLSEYRNVLKKHDCNWDVVYFDKKWFSRLRSYSQMLMRDFFYEAFSSYSFLQIYQLDAWVFRDELDLWCERGFSFIGAPFLDREPYCVGNGGFSLRRVSDCRRILSLGHELNQNVPLVNPRLQDDWRRLNWKGRIMVIARRFGLCRSYRYFLEKSTIDEDAFWGTMAPNLHAGFSVPNVDVAARYSYDANPRLANQIAKGILPFGCHGWEKWDKAFWMDKIKRG